MDKVEALQLKLKVERLVKLAILQSESLMNLSTAILSMDDVPKSAKEDALMVFSGIQEQLDLLSDIQGSEDGDVESDS